MREKINLLAKGNFEYGCPDVHLSDQKLNIEVEAGSLFRGEFHVFSTNGIDIRAKIFSSNRQMHCKETDMIGRDNTVHYEFDAANMEPGNQVEGKITLISNGGEVELPYEATARGRYCLTTFGEVSNIDEFSIMASEQWKEAVDLFKSEDFHRVFLINKINAHIYEKLMRSRNVNQAMEEFLYTLNKKDKIVLNVSRNEEVYDNIEEVISEKLRIEKNTWGYQEIFVHVEGDFLGVYKKRLTTLDFEDNIYDLEYFVNPEFLYKGWNHGKIILKTFSQTIEISIRCYQEILRDEEEGAHPIRKSLDQLYRHYILWRAGRIEKADWIKVARENIDCLRNNDDQILYALMEANFLIHNKRVEQASAIMDSINSRELRKTSLLEYCYYLYITTLYRKEPDYQHFVINRLWEFYESRCDRWEVLWMLLQIDEHLSVGGLHTFKRIKQEFDKGCHSPIMYQEAVSIANGDPSVIRSLDTFECQILYWGTRHQLIGRPLIFQYADLCVKEKSYDSLVLKSMFKLYEENESKDILYAICSLLIKGHKTDECYNIWYERGILEELKLTQLYEFYMFSLDESKVETMPSAVLYYFNYNNQLDWKKKAFLYRYILERREERVRIYRAYEGIMKAFTMDQLSKGNIDRNLSVLYRFYINKDMINHKLAIEMPNIMFKHFISCSHPGIVNVIVTMRDIDKEFIYPLTSETAYVDIFTDEYNIAFEDSMGSRYMKTVDYQIEKLMDETEYLKACYEMFPENAKLVMTCSEKALKYHMIDDTAVDIFKRAVKIVSISPDYGQILLKTLMDIYQDNYEGETLEKYMIRLDVHKMSSEERSKMVEYYISRGFYDKAFSIVTEYGYPLIQKKPLMRLCSRMIRKREYKKEELLLNMAFDVFSAGKYDNVILEYLDQHYVGTSEDYMNIWNAARDFETKVHEIEERILCQVLFTESRIKESQPVFDSYYAENAKPGIVSAYLCYTAYQSLVSDEKLPATLVQAMEIEMNQMKHGRDVCSLAVLKYYSEIVEDDKLNYEEIYDEVQRFICRGVMLPWFSKFINCTDLPHELADKVFAVYTTNPSHTVKVRYRIDVDGREGIWQEESMQNIYGGIFGKAWTIFANEKLIWQALDDDGEDIVVTEMKELTCDVDGGKEVVSGIDAINRMVLEKEFNDYDALYTTAYAYSKKKALASEVFEIL